MERRQRERSPRHAEFHAPRGIARATGRLSNPTTFHQYSQTTGVGPIRVRLFNIFGTFARTGSGGGGGAVGSGTGLPGSGATYGGDDPPQGVLLHVNCANMFLPSQAQVNQLNNTTGFGGFGHAGFSNPGASKGGYLGNGDSGL
jgi:hypothetical protein